MQVGEYNLTALLSSPQLFTRYAARHLVSQQDVEVRL